MLRSLQALRGLAATMVVLFHTHLILTKAEYAGQTPFGGIFSIGYSGVDIFFVLSGFIIVSAHHADLDQPAKLGRYLHRRFIRVYPVYWLFLTGMIVLLLAGIGEAVLGPAEIASAYSLVRFSPERPPLSVAWSLFHEILFYAVFAVMIVRRRIGMLLFAAWMAFALVCYAAGWVEPFAEQESGFGVLGSLFNLNFAFGIGVFLLAARLAPQARLAALLLGLAFFAAGAERSYADAAEEWRILFGIAAFFLILAAVAQERASGMAVPRWAVFLGDASYSVYLVHYPVLSLEMKVMKALGLLDRLPVEVSFVVAFVGAMIAGCLAYATVERPLLNVLRSKRRTIRGAEPAVS